MVERQLAERLSVVEIPTPCLELWSVCRRIYESRYDLDGQITKIGAQDAMGKRDIR